jgi:hypothetical protein
MQTFLPYKDFKKSAEALDYRRLGKQRVEAMQIINAITGIPRKDGKVYRGWVNHPCSVMWRNNVPALMHYCNVMIKEWKKRGYNNTMKLYDVSGPDVELPSWVGNEDYHASHRANLLRKEIEYYKDHGWKDDPKDPYLWKDVEGKWYKQHVGTGEKEYL